MRNILGVNIVKIHNKVDRQLHESDVMNNIITFNGQGLSGKSTQSKRLVESDDRKYKRIHSYTLRSVFREEIYNALGRKETCITYPEGHCQTLYEVEVLGIPSLAWLTACFHKEVKPRQEENYIVVLDHYIGDFYTNMLTCFDPDKFQCFVKDHLGIPHFKQGIHFYLDIDYDTYLDRWEKVEEAEPHKRRELKVEKEDFEARRGRYKELCDKGYLEYINAVDVSGLDEKESVNEVTKKIKSVVNKQLGCA